jgi:hypothetical protein
MEGVVSVFIKLNKIHQNTTQRQFAAHTVFLQNPTKNAILRIEEHEHNRM